MKQPDVDVGDRITLCKSCPSLGIGNICKECGCFMPLKVRFKKASCPLGKWRSFEPDSIELTNEKIDHE